MKEENLNDNVSNDTNEIISRLKEKYKQRREYSLGYLDYVNQISDDANRVYSPKNVILYRDYLNSMIELNNKRLRLEKRLNELGI